MSIAFEQTDRAAEPTPPQLGNSSRQQTNQTVARLATAEPGAIDRRLRELHGEWNLERTLEVNAAAAALVGLGLGAFVDRRFFLLPHCVQRLLGEGGREGQ